MSQATELCYFVVLNTCVVDYGYFLTEEHASNRSDATVKSRRLYNKKYTGSINDGSSSVAVVLFKMWILLQRTEERSADGIIWLVGKL